VAVTWTPTVFMIRQLFNCIFNIRPCAVVLQALRYLNPALCLNTVRWLHESGSEWGSSGNVTLQEIYSLKLFSHFTWLVMARGIYLTATVQLW